MSTPLLSSGIDLNQLPMIDGPCGTTTGITPDALMQLVNNASLLSGMGIIYSKNTPPDYTVDPSLQYFFWRDTSGAPPYPIKQLNPNSLQWEEIQQTTIDGASILEDSIAIEALHIPPGVANNLIAVNSTSTGLQFRTLLSLIANNSVPVSALQIPVGTPTGSSLIVTPSGIGFSIINVAEIVAAMGPKTIKISQLYKDTAGTTGNALRVAADGSIVANVADATPPAAQLPTPTLSDANKIAFVNSGGSAYVIGYISTLLPNIANFNTIKSGNLAFPAPMNLGSGNHRWAIEWSHGLGAAIDDHKACLVCITSHGSFKLGHIIQVESVITPSNNIDIARSGGISYHNNTVVGLIIEAYGLNLYGGVDYTIEALDLSKWAVRFYAIRYL
jgi:hypothetical protein